MGLQVGVFSKVGDDPNGRFLVSELSGANVDVSGIRASAAETTPFTFVGVHPDGDRTFIHTPGTNVTLNINDLDLDSLYRADILLYQDAGALPALDGEQGTAVLSEARRRYIITALDECWGFGPDREKLEPMIAHCDYFLPSLDDLRAIYPDASVREIADHLLGIGAGTVAIKMGSAGCLVAAGEMRAHVPAFPAQVMDTTGAGDCWDAGFLAAVAGKKDLITAARMGHACAAFCIESVGGALGVPDYRMVEARAGINP